MMNYELVPIITNQYKQLKQNKAISPLVWQQAQDLYEAGACKLLSQAKNVYEYWVTDSFKDSEVRFTIWENQIDCLTQPHTQEWGKHSLAAFLQLIQDIRSQEQVLVTEGKKYTREGMMKRVLAERRARAEKANYTIYFADNIYGEHLLINERGIRYKITLRDFDSETGYCDTPDWRTNKLGTTKHIMFAFKKLKSDKALYEKLNKTYPFVEIYTDPLRDYMITWYYPHQLPPQVEQLIRQYFGSETHIPMSRVTDFLGFIRKAENHKEILIRREVHELVERQFDELMLEEVKRNYKVDFSSLKTDLFPYQKEGIEFGTFRSGAIIADEMGLGKTLQAIGVAIAKKDIFGFNKCLVITPASLKAQWKREIERFSHEIAQIIEGNAEQRIATYKEWQSYFIIANYETVLRDINFLKNIEIDFVILDEAQKIKNFTSQTANAVKALDRKHSLVITGTPLENNLTELYSIVSFVDPYFLAPLWEFSYQYCYYDEKQPDKVTGYYNLQQLNERMRPILIRREKRHVIKELPFVSQVDVWVNLHPDQKNYHDDCAAQIAKILHKKFLTPFDSQRLMLLLQEMRMVCDSTLLIDNAEMLAILGTAGKKPVSPKLEELEYILLEKLDIKNTKRKIIIFSEWVKMLQAIGHMLRKHNIGFVELTGSVAVSSRDKLVTRFETDDNCKIFLSTEAGGSGLNLQVADTVINFELPWNPAKKNQRIGRIDRLGQTSKHLTVINLITHKSIEARISAGLSLKQNLFDGVLDNQATLNIVDMSAQGRAYFIEQLTEIIEAIDQDTIETEERIKENPFDAPDWEEVDTEDVVLSPPTTAEVLSSVPVQPTASEIQTVLSQGVVFLSGLIRMATGKELSLSGNEVEVNPQTGEVTLRFKLPVNQ